MRSVPGSLRSEGGQVSLLIIGFAVVLAMGIAVVVDATAAYLQRDGLNSLADGAALRGADLGATGTDVYEGGVPDERLALTQEQAQRAVAAYLTETGARSRYPGLRAAVAVDAANARVLVRLSAPLDLPLTVPGSPGSTTVAATGSAVVGVD